MAEESSADSYIGSFISLISKAEIRYQGFLLHINPQQSTIGLQNVKSFGTEGRRKDGPQVLPNDKVYEYIFFRGSDIKDLQVISSPPFQTPAVPNDPAIIQSHYPHTTASSSFSSASGVPAINSSSSERSQLPYSTFQGNLPLNHQPLGSLGSSGSLPPSSTANGNGITMPTYWPGHKGPSGGVSHLQHQSLLQPPQVLPVSPPLQQQMQNPIMNASLPGDASNFAEFSHPMLPAVGIGSPSLTSLPSALPSVVPVRQSPALPSELSPNLIPNNACNAVPTVTLGSNSPLASPLMASSVSVNPVVPPVLDKPKSVSDPALPYQTSVPISQSATLPSKLSPNLMPNNSSNALPSVTLCFNSPLTSPLMTSSFSVNPVVPPVVDKPMSVSVPALPYQAISQSSSSIVGSSNPVHSETSMPSLLIPGQLLLPGPTIQSPPHLQTAHKDIEVIQESTSELLSPDSENAMEPAQPLPSSSAEKMNGATLHPHRGNKHHVRGRGSTLKKAALHTHHSKMDSERDLARGKGYWLNGVALRSNHSYRSHARGRENGLCGAALHLRQCNKGHSRGRENGPNTAGVHTHLSGRVRRWGKGTERNTAAVHTHLSYRGFGWGNETQVLKFTEDFDFEAMNKKFNKEEIWGHLGKSNKTKLENEGEETDNDASDTEEEVEDGLLKLDVKHVYVKDDFFDSLSCNSLNGKTGRGRAKISEQRRIDFETFGEISRHHRRGYSSQGPGWRGRSRGSQFGQGYGYIGRGRGRTVWCRVT